jgi:hypothetical protein
MTISHSYRLHSRTSNHKLLDGSRNLSTGISVPLATIPDETLQGSMPYVSVLISLALLTFLPRNPLLLSPGSSPTTMPTLTRRRLIPTRTGLLNMCRGCAFKFVTLLTSPVQYLFLNHSLNVHITEWFVTKTGINSIYIYG